MRTPLFFVAALVLAGCTTERTAAPAETAAADATLTITSRSTEAVEHMKRGEHLLDNLRPVDAAVEFNQALEIDPEFALARALLGQATPGAAGLKEIETAASATSGVSEGERALIEGMLAARRGEAAKAEEAYRRVTQVAPGDWRGYHLLGQQLMGAEKYGDAERALTKATELNPQAGGAHNMLGYAALRQGNTSGAIAAFTEYARVLPEEPNPQDSLGEALLAAGKFSEAEAAFRKAAELSPEFWNAWDGVAYAKFFAGDAAGARQALEKARDLAPRPGDKLAIDQLSAAMAEASGNVPQALQILQTAEQMTDAPGVVFVPVQRATTLIDRSRGREALPLLAAAVQRADSGDLPPAPSRNLRVQALRARIYAEASLNEAGAAEKTAAALESEASARTDDRFAQSSMHYGQGMLAMVRSDFMSARSHFEQCSKVDEFCRLQIVTAAERAGDGAAASAAKAELMKLYVRDPVHVIVRSRLAAPSRGSD
jgi:Flp pilus assembly protein TadD